MAAKDKISLKGGIFGGRLSIKDEDVCTLWFSGL